MATARPFSYTQTMSPYGKLVEPTDYLEVTRKYLQRCGPDAKVGQIWETMRDKGTPVGYWLNPCLIYLDPERFGHLKVSKNRVLMELRSRLSSTTGAKGRRKR